MPTTLSLLLTALWLTLLLMEEGRMALRMRYRLLTHRLSLGIALLLLLGLMGAFRDQHPHLLQRRLPFLFPLASPHP